MNIIATALIIGIIVTGIVVIAAAGLYWIDRIASKEIDRLTSL